MDRALCYFSFDYDLTVTKKHTWDDLKLANKKPETVARAAEVNLIQYTDAQLLADLIEFVCGTYRMVFCFCTMQYREILEAGLKANPILYPVYEKYVGTRLFIIDRAEIGTHHRSNKALALSSTFKVSNPKHGGVHMDDTMKHESDFAAKNIDIIPMTPGTGFSKQLDSSFNTALTYIEGRFSNIARPKNYPTPSENVFSTASQPGASRVPPGFDFRFLAISRKDLTMDQFMKELRSATMASFSRQGAVRRPKPKSKL